MRMVDTAQRKKKAPQNPEGFNDRMVETSEETSTINLSFFMSSAASDHCQSITK